MARKYQQGGFQARVQIDVEETGAPLVFWPDDFRGQLKALIQAGAATEHSALAWYRWKYADSCWQSVLFLPEEDIAIVELGAGNTAIVSSVNTPEEALRRLVSKNVMPNPTGCGCRGQFGMLHEYDTARELRPATRKERDASRKAALRDGGAGVIKADGRRCYVQE